MKFIPVTYTDSDLIKSFLDNAGTSLQAFRYFKTRPVDIIKNHIYTVLLIDDNNTPLAYGHLDHESSITWLGMAVSEAYTGKGLGKMMLAHLIDFAKKKQIERICLSVDNDNVKATNLYLGFDFTLQEKKEAIGFYELNLLK